MNRPSAVCGAISTLRFLVTRDITSLPRVVPVRCRLDPRLYWGYFAFTHPRAPPAHPPRPHMVTIRFLFLGAQLIDERLSRTTVAHPQIFHLLQPSQMHPQLRVAPLAVLPQAAPRETVLRRFDL